MGNLTIWGLVSCLGGLLLAGYQGLIGLMYEKTGWYDITVWDLGGAPLDSAIEHMPQWIMDFGMDYFIYDLPFYQFLIVFGVVLLIAGAFLDK